MDHYDKVGDILSYVQRYEPGQFKGNDVEERVTFVKTRNILVRSMLYIFRHRSFDTYT
jgi:hypothetical protein